jgi:D-glucuronyl C5-epimerase C-terminus
MKTAVAMTIVSALLVFGGHPTLGPPVGSTPASAPSVFGPYDSDGIKPLANVAAPYSDQAPADVNSAKFDSTGVAIYIYPPTGKRVDHPVVYAQYGLSALLQYDRTRNPVWLERAVANADRLIAIHTTRGSAWWYPYTFNWTYLSRTLTAPWWSGMAQGEALSLFTRLAEQEPQDKTWRTAADATFASFTQTRSTTQPWSTVVDHGHLWFEEYAGDQPPLLVFNGHVFATFGIYDYWKMTGNGQAAALFSGAATTVLDVMPQIRVPGGVAYYCAEANYCQTPAWQNPHYHPVDIWELQTLQRLTGNVQFGNWAKLLASDWTAPPAQVSADFANIAQEVG